MTCAIIKSELRCEKTGLRGVPTRPDTNRSVQSLKKAKSLKFRIQEEDCVAKTKVPISFAVTAKLICAFCFRIGKNLVFSWRGSGLIFLHLPTFGFNYLLHSLS